MHGRISHSEACAYWDCQKKWYLQYVKGIKKETVYTQFGSMAHKVLETGVIPEEYLYPELKEAFGINSWTNYFTQILSSVKDYLKDKEIIAQELKFEDKITGVIDIICKDGDGNIYIYDFKFPSVSKDYGDISLDEQLHLYAYLYAKTAWIPLDKITIGYISLPRTEVLPPTKLKNGSLSKAKSQNTTYELYLSAINENHLNIDDYKEVLEDLKSKPLLNVITTKPSDELIENCVKNLMLTMKDMEKGYVLESFSSHKCKNCDYLKECKLCGTK